MTPADWSVSLGEASAAEIAEMVAAMRAPRRCGQMQYVQNH